MSSEPVGQVIGDSLDKSILAISSMAEGYAREYLATIVAQLIVDLEKAGFKIVESK